MKRQLTNYHNTTYATGKQLAEYEVQATKQDSQVLEFMAHNDGYGFTAEHIADYVLPWAPITSARRALTNLYNQDRIIKVGQIDGEYGRPVTVWQYRRVS